MIIEAIALTYKAALHQTEIESVLIYDSKIPKKCNSDIWIKKLERINKNTGMIPRLRGLHGEDKNRHGKLLLQDLINAKHGYVVIELNGVELKRHREFNNMKWTRNKVFKFVTFSKLDNF